MISVFRTLVDLFLRWNRKKLFYFARRSMHLNIFIFLSVSPNPQSSSSGQLLSSYSVLSCRLRLAYARGETLQLSTHGLMSIEYWACYWENGRSCWLMYRQGWWLDATGYFLNQHQATSGIRPQEKGVSWLNKSIQTFIFMWISNKY